MNFKIKYFTPILAMAVVFSLSSCDEGRIYEDEFIPDTSGRVMKFSGTIHGMRTWAKGYSLVLGGFEGNSTYATITKPLPFPTEEDDLITLVMTGIPKEVTSVKLCIVNRLREEVLSYVELPCSGSEEDTIRMEDVSEDVNMYDALQSQIFDDVEYGCTKCHGKNDHSAGNVNLTRGKSYQTLTTQHSRLAGKDTMLVTPGNSAASTLYLLLGTPFGEKAAYNHSNILINSYTDVALIQSWIDNGAKER